MAGVTDDEVLRFIADTEAGYPPEANEADAAGNRRFYDAMCAVFRSPRPEGLVVEDRPVGGVRCRIYAPDASQDRPFALYLHGGGFVVGSLDSHDDVCAELADATGLTVVSADYRLAPEHVHPAQLDDAEAVWRALSADRRAGVVMGDSAGANLAAGLCLRMRRAAGPAPRGQILIYPGLGGDRSLPSYEENAFAPLLRTSDLDHYAAARFGGAPRDWIDPEAAPLTAESLARLPPAFVSTADVDPLRDDGRAYVERLRAAGVSAVWRNEPQLPHGWLRARHRSLRAARAFAAIVASLGRLTV